MLNGVSLLVPCFKSEESLPILCERLSIVMDRQGGDYEILLIEDGSPDCTWETITALAQKYERVRGWRMLRNYGQHNALLWGIRQARYCVIVTLDDDLQNPPEELPQMLAKLAEGYDVVYGAPIRQNHGWVRNMASTAAKWVLQDAMGAETARNVSAFRVFRASLREAFANYRSPLVSIDVLLTWGAQRFTFIRVRNDPRMIGQSNYSFAKLFVHAMNMMTGFSVTPLRLASWLGFFLTMFGFLILTWVLGRYLIEGSDVPGFPFLASIISAFSGAQLLTLGIFGEYLARIHIRATDRPCYSVDASTESIEQAEANRT